MRGLYLGFLRLDMLGFRMFVFQQGLLRLESVFLLGFGVGDFGFRGLFLVRGL